MKEEEEKLEDVIIDEGVETLGDEYYTRRYEGKLSPINVQRIIFPKSLKVIYENAYAPGRNAVDDDIMRGYYHMEYARSSKIRELIFQEGLKRIESHAFFQVQKLEKVVIPKSIEFIAKDAFQGTNRINELHLDCTSLLQINIKSLPKTKESIISYSNYEELEDVITKINRDNVIDLCTISTDYKKVSFGVEKAKLCFEGPELTKEQKEKITKLIKKEVKQVKISFNVKELEAPKEETKSETLPPEQELDELSKLKKEITTLSNSISTYIDKDSIEKEIESVINEYKEYEENTKPKINWDNEIKIDVSKKATKEDAIERLNTIKERLNRLNDYKQLFESLNDTNTPKELNKDDTIEGLLGSIRYIISQIKGSYKEKFFNEYLTITNKYKNKVNQIINSNSKKEYEEVENELREEIQELLKKISNVNYLNIYEKNNNANVLEQLDQSKELITQEKPISADKINSEIINDIVVDIKNLIEYNKEHIDEETEKVIIEKVLEVINNNIELINKKRITSKEEYEKQTNIILTELTHVKKKIIEFINNMKNYKNDLKR